MTKLYVQKLFLCKGVRNGYLLGHNADILWSEYTYGSSNNFCMSKNRDTFGSEGVPVPLDHFSQKKLWRSTVVKFQHSVWPTILSTAKHISLPFPRSEQVFFTILLFDTAPLDEEEWKVSHSYSIP